MDSKNKNSCQTCGYEHHKCDANNYGCYDCDCVLHHTCEEHLVRSFQRKKLVERYVSPYTTFDDDDGFGWNEDEEDIMDEEDMFSGEYIYDGKKWVPNPKYTGEESSDPDDSLWMFNQ